MMSRELICPRGHRWEMKGSAGASRAVCPTCGEIGMDCDTHGPDQTAISELPTLDPSEIPSLVAPTPATRVSPAAAERTQVKPLRIGNYEVVDELGRGGMGVVYKARHHDLERFVAIKMILAGGYASAESARRLRIEAEAVARLQHPNIVQIFDVGEHDGQPFLVLEYLQAGNLARKIAGKPQPPRVAAELIRTLSRAIDYAHINGILHRDLTPSNVLLSALGVTPRTGAAGPAAVLDLAQAMPKITDFGLAKRLDDDASQTRAGVVMGTPSYMAPEQASGNLQDAGPSCDIYSLGAILYELLSGRPPFIAETALLTIEQVLQQEPVPPTRLQPRLPRDLETICLKCLEKEPAKRYASAGALADDLDRFLKGEPIFARRTGAAARVWRWSKRRPALAALIVVSAAATVALLAGSYWSNGLIRAERDRAEDNLSLSLRAVDGMLTEVGEVDFAYEPRLDEKRLALLARALALYQEFLARQADDPRLQLETAQAHRRIGDIERWLGNQEAAGAAYERAIPLFERLRLEQPTRPEMRRWLAYCQNYLGEVHRQSSRPQLAERAYARAMAQSAELKQEFPESVEYAQDLARAKYNAGILFRETNRADQAEKALTAAELELESLTKSHADDASLRQDLARVKLNLGAVYRATARSDRAIACDDEAIQLYAALAKAFPQQREYRYELAVAHSNRGNVYNRLGDNERAQGDYQAAGELLRKLIDDYPSAPSLRQELANTYNSLAAAQAAAGDVGGAQQTWTKAVELLRELVAQHGSVPAYRADLGMTLGNLGWALAKQKQFAQAHEMLTEGVGHLQEFVRTNPDHPDYGPGLHSHLKELGRVSLELKDHASAAAAAQALVAFNRQSANESLAAACLMLRAANVADGDPALDEAARAQAAGRYRDEAAEWILAAAALGVNDAALLDEARELLQASMGQHAGLGAAHDVLFAPQEAPAAP